MSRKQVYLGCVALVLCLGGAARAGVFSDDFEAAHDYLVDGVAGTGWDGFIGAGAGETASALNASTDRSGQLFMQSAGAYWEGAFSPRGPFLYKVVEGDFVATVRVTDFAGVAGAIVQHNDSFLMARVANLDDAGAGEDFVCMHYFPTWVGNMQRNMDDSVETEGTTTGDGFNCARYLQVERTGNVFTFRRSFDGVTWTAVGGTLTREDMGGLALQVGMAHCTYSATAGYVAFDDFTLSGDSIVPMNMAYRPKPSNGATDVLTDVVLSWVPTDGAVAHDVYFGTDVDAVTAAEIANPLGVMVVAGHDANSYDVGHLAYGQTCYWRIDEVTADGTSRGAVWSFAVEPYAYPITGITATASSTYNANTLASKTVDGSGLDENDLHGDDLKTMWASQKNAPEPAWIQFEFDAAYKLDRVLVWNSNQAIEALMGVGVKDATVEVSLDGVNWTTLATVELAQGTGEPLEPEVFDLGGVVAKYVKLTVGSNWGGLVKQYSLSEVRFYYVPVSAREPSPADGATDVHPQATLGWRAGREAASHKVALSVDEQAVIDGTADVVTVSEPQYEISLDLDQSYFWKVVEVNDAEEPAAWEGDVWSFTTAEYIVVDDFESYTDDMDAGEAVFQTWTDGYEDDTNGSLVGYNDAPFTERTVVHDGYQSMPLAYDNSGGIYSEAKRTFETAQDWSRHGVTTLVLHWHGLAANASAPLYVKINNTKVLYNAGAGATNLPVWKQWNIDLAATGANLKSVTSLTIGIGDGKAGGTGMIHVDDIRLYAEAPEVVTPVDPGNTGILANYTFEGNVQDSSGNNNHGTVTGDAGYEDAPSGYGQALIFNGINAYVTLPIGSVLSSLSDMTITVYVNFPAATGDWQRIFDFGSSTTNYMFLTPRTTSSGPMRFAIRTDAVGEQAVDGPGVPVGWHHVAVVMDSATMTMRLHLDGATVASGVTSLLPKDLGDTTQNYLGESQYEADALFTGSLADLRIYNRALSEAQVRYLAGDR
ncbi:MAG: LamG-like jellyroll fold domain-containing protein [Phycisphaerales bacterium]